ncbi:MAG TPA: hypothetical protein VF308_09065, partial [Caldimonas sp.]
MGTLFKALNLEPKTPVAGAKASSRKPLQDSDFPADAKRRKLADEEARKTGRTIAEAKPDASGDGPKKSTVDGKIDGAVDDFIDEKGKQLRKLNKDMMPGFADVFEEMSPEEAFLDDMAKGAENAKEQIEFIQKTLAYAEKVGDAAALAPIAEASKNLQKISERVLGGLGKAGKAISTAKQIVVFYQALKGFADASGQMSADRGKSVEAWVASVKSLWNASKPFVDTFKDKAFTAALGGSEAAAAASATLAIVGAELYIGIRLLDQGVKNVNAYFERLHRLTREDSDHVVADAPPQAPVAPLPFSTREETIASLKRHDEMERQKKALRAKNAKAAKEEDATARALEDFNERVFPKVYLKYRPTIRDKIYGAYRKAG